MTQQEKPTPVPPPFPAPYLAAVPNEIPPELLRSERNPNNRAEQIKMDRYIRTLKEQIFFARRDFETEKNICIVPEPPLVP